MWINGFFPLMWKLKPKGDWIKLKNKCAIEFVHVNGLVKTRP